MDLTIIIVSWNTCHLLQKCLYAVYEKVKDIQYETFVVDNASSDGSQAMIRQNFPWVRLIENATNNGFAAANNQAINASSGKYILFLNSDAFLSEMAVDRMVLTLENQSQTGIVGPRLVSPDGHQQDDHGKLPNLRSEIIALLGLDTRIKKGTVGDSTPVESGWVMGACLMARRSMLSKIGQLDERYFMFGEEIDLCYRAQKSDWQVIYLPTVKVVHIQGGSSGFNSRRVLMLYRSKLQYFHKHFGSTHSKLLYQSMVITVLTKRIYYSLLQRTDLKRMWREVWQGLSELKARDVAA